MTQLKGAKRGEIESATLKSLLRYELRLSLSAFKIQAPVVRKVDSAIHWINYYPLDSAIGCRNTYPLDSDLSGG